MPRTVGQRLKRTGLVAVAAFVAIQLLPLIWLPTPPSWAYAMPVSIDKRPLFLSEDGTKVYSLESSLRIGHDAENGVITRTHLTVRASDWLLKYEEPVDHPGLPSRAELMKQFKADFESLCLSAGQPDLVAHYDAALGKSSLDIEHSGRGLLIFWRWIVFSINQLLHLAILVAVIVALCLIPGLFTERRRARAGGCIRCGYNLAGLNSPVCPECGGPAVARV